MKTVITGDIVDSSSLSMTRREQVISNISQEVDDFQMTSPFQEEQSLFYRGDSFQLVMNENEDALLLALFIRCRVLMTAENTEDVRQSIGIGSTDQLTNSIVNSDGDAFRFSGRGLEQMKENRLVVQSVDDHWNAHINTSFVLLDDIVSKWSKEMAEAIYFSLKGETQQEIADRLHIKQPSVHKRLKTGGFKSIEQLIKHYKESISWISS